MSSSSNVILKTYDATETTAGTAATAVAATAATAVTAVNPNIKPISI
jgi:hypothetical protein